MKEQDSIDVNIKKEIKKNLCDICILYDLCNFKTPKGLRNCYTTICFNFKEVVKNTK